MWLQSLQELYIYFHSLCPKIQQDHLWLLICQYKDKHSGSTPRESIDLCSVGVIYQIYIFCQNYSQCNILASLGVLPQLLYHFYGSTPTKVVQYLWVHSQTVKKQTLGVLIGSTPTKVVQQYWEYSQRPKITITGSTPRTFVLNLV